MNINGLKSDRALLTLRISAPSSWRLNLEFFLGPRPFGWSKNIENDLLGSNFKLSKFSCKSWVNMMTTDSPYKQYDQNQIARSYLLTWHIGYDDVRLT